MVEGTREREEGGRDNVAKVRRPLARDNAASDTL